MRSAFDMLDSAREKTATALNSSLEVAKSGANSGLEFAKSGANKAASGVGSAFGGVGDSTQVLKVLRYDLWIRLAPWQYPKVGRVVAHMQHAGYSDEEVNIVVKAVFVSQSDEDFQAAFDMFCKKIAAGFSDLGAEDLKQVLPLIGETLDEAKINDLFDEVDSDKSGRIELPEFIVLLKACNPMDGSAGGFGVLKSIGLDNTMGALSGIDTTTKMRLNPLELNKAGKAFKKFEGAGYSHEECNIAIKALFLASDENAQSAFDMFDQKFSPSGQLQGKIGMDNFKQLVGLLAEENIDQEAVDALYNEIETQKGSSADLNDFKRAISLAHPQGRAFVTNVPGASSLGDAWTSLSVLSATTKLRLNPLQLPKVGRVVERLQQKEYSDEDIDKLVKAVFVTQDDEDFKPVFKIFAKESDNIKLDSFKEVLHLVGEDVPESKLEELFKEADNDQSGDIGFAEFVVLMKAMNPKSDKPLINFKAYTPSMPNTGEIMNSVTSGFGLFKRSEPAPAPAAPDAASSSTAGK